MTGKDLIEKYSEGVNNLFKEETFKLKVIFSEVQVPCYRTNGTNREIAMPKTIENLVFDKTNLNIEFLTLVALGHETAHYLNNHNSIFANVHDNALELWADFFGAKILFTLFLHDNFFKSHYSFFETPEILISNYYSGLCCVYEYYYSNANIRYPSKEFRIQIGLASITSVFSYFENNLRNKYSVIAVKVFSENENFDKGSYTATQSEMKVIFPQIMEIHRLIQGKDAFISKDMKEEYLNYITTAYI